MTKTDPAKNRASAGARLMSPLVALERFRQDKLIAPLDRGEIAGKVYDEARFTGRYAFMCAMSCGIAILGLLLSSPAVVIGAMLISPLMGPIVGLGFSLATFDFDELKRSLWSLLLGAGLSLGVAIVIVKFSPLTEATSEILARTRPSFFDLLVAVFSGLAGGYATIKGRGGAIVGVAIATALMPPLAVTGWGIGVGAWDLARGAGFLFMTNLIAIALSVTGLARLYGFGTGLHERSNWAQSILIVGAFVGLSLPLIVSLRQIAAETRSVSSVREVIEQVMADADPQVEGLSVRLGADGTLQASAAVLVSRYSPTAADLVTGLLEDRLGRPVTFDLDQIEAADTASGERQRLSQAIAELRAASDRSAADARAFLEPFRARQTVVDQMRQAIVFPVSFSDIDPTLQRARIQAAQDPAFGFRALRTLENELSERFADWDIAVIPPVRPLPLVAFEAGESELTADGVASLDDAAWALTRWGVFEVEAAGRATIAAEARNVRSPDLAEARAEAVAAALSERGILATARADHPLPDQAAIERDRGARAVRTVALYPVVEEVAAPGGEPPPGAPQ